MLFITVLVRIFYAFGFTVHYKHCIPRDPLSIFGLAHEVLVFPIKTVYTAISIWLLSGLFMNTYTQQYFISFPGFRSEYWPFYVRVQSGFNTVRRRGNRFFFCAKDISDKTL